MGLIICRNRDLGEKCYFHTNFDKKLGIIHLVRTQNFQKNLHFLPPDTDMYVYVTGGNKCWFFRKFWIITKWMIP